MKISSSDKHYKISFLNFNMFLVLLDVSLKIKTSQVHLWKSSCHKHHISSNSSIQSFSMLFPSDHLSHGQYLRYMWHKYRSINSSLSALTLYKIFLYNFFFFFYCKMNYLISKQKSLRTEFKNQDIWNLNQKLLFLLFRVGH